MAADLHNRSRNPLLGRSCPQETLRDSQEDSLNGRSRACPPCKSPGKRRQKRVRRLSKKKKENQGRRYVRYTNLTGRQGIA